MNHVANQALKGVLAEFKWEVEEAVRAHLEAALKEKETEEHLRHLFMQDALNNNANNYKKIYETAVNLFQAKRSIFVSIVRSIIGALSNVNSGDAKYTAFMKGLSTASTLVSTVSELSKIVELTDKVCDNLSERIAEYDNRFGYAHVLERHLRPLVDLNDAREIVAILESKGIIVSGKLVPEKVISQGIGREIGVVDFGKFAKLKNEIICICEKIVASELSTQKNYQYKFEKLVSDITHIATNTILSQFRSEVMMPALSSPLAKLSDKVAEEVGEIAASLGAKLSANEQKLREMERHVASNIAQQRSEVVITGAASGEGYVSEGKKEEEPAAGPGPEQEPKDSAQPIQESKRKKRANDYKEPVEGLPWLQEVVSDNAHLLKGDVNKNNTQTKPQAEQTQASQGVVINTDNITPETMATIQAILSLQNNSSTRSSILIDQSENKHWSVVDAINELVGTSSTEANVGIAAPVYGSTIGAAATWLTNIGILGGIPYAALTNPTIALGGLALASQPYKHYSLSKEVSSLIAKADELGVHHDRVINRDTMEQDMWMNMANPNIMDSVSMSNAFMASEKLRYEAAIGEGKVSKSTTVNLTSNGDIQNADVNANVDKPGILLSEVQELKPSDFINWTPTPNPLPPLPGFIPEQSRPMIFSLQKHEQNILDYILSTPIKDYSKLYQLPGFEAHDFDEHDFSVLFKNGDVNTISTSKDHSHHEAGLKKQELSSFDYDKTPAVEISGKRAIDLGKSYEESISKMYGASDISRKYEILFEGKELKGTADHVIIKDGKRIAIEAKYVDDWSTSPRNPISAQGQLPFMDQQQEMINQAKKYSLAFKDGIIYHTNSVEFANHYTKVFNELGIKNFKFVITPAIKK